MVMVRIYIYIYIYIGQLDYMHGIHSYQGADDARIGTDFLGSDTLLV